MTDLCVAIVVILVFIIGLAIGLNHATEVAKGKVLIANVGNKLEVINDSNAIVYVGLSPCSSYVAVNRKGYAELK